QGLPTRRGADDYEEGAEDEQQQHGTNRASMSLSADPWPPLRIVPVSVGNEWAGSVPRSGVISAVLADLGERPAGPGERRGPPFRRPSTSTRRRAASPRSWSDPLRSARRDPRDPRRPPPRRRPGPRARPPPVAAPGSAPPLRSRRVRRARGLSASSRAGRDETLGRCPPG